MKYFVAAIVLSAACLFAAESSSIAKSASASASSASLGRTIRLTFKFETDDTQAITITTAGGKFTTNQNYSGDDGKGEHQISGELRNIEGESGKVMLMYEALEGWQGSNGEGGDAQVSGSAVLELGKKIDLAKNGHYGLNVEAVEVK
jgi:hypothetical protein